MTRAGSGLRGALCGPEPLCISPLQVLEFAGTLPAHTQHLLLALCHFLLPGHGDSKSLLWPGARVAGGGASWTCHILAKELPSLAPLGLPWGRGQGLRDGGSLCPQTSLHFCPVPQEEAVGPWYHPSAQEIQPLFGEHRLEEDGRGWVKTRCCLADAWHGGSSLLIRGLIPPEVGDVAVR